MTDEARIESLGAGGAGVTHLADGMIAFVPRTAPGDLVKLTGIKRHKRHATARAAAIVEPGPDRVDPPCRHFTFDHCGGCQWQHVSYPAQLAAKRRIVGDALRRIGKRDVADPDVMPSPREYGYRTTITLTVRRRGGHVIAGFHDERDPDVVFLLERCHIARPELQALWDAIKGAIHHLPEGDDVRLRLRVGEDGSLHAVVSGGDKAWTNGEPLTQAAGGAGMFLTVWWHPAGGAPRRVSGPDADPAVVSFGQVNAEVAAMMKRRVIDQAIGQPGGRARRRILDLYAGSGDTAIPLARQGHDVELVEMDARAVRRAELLAEQEGVKLGAHAGNVEARLEKLLPADAVIVNPPRTGLGEYVAQLLGSSSPQLLVYVSCDPATLSRDLNRMQSRLVSVTAYDMFPQTSHVETLVVAE